MPISTPATPERRRLELGDAFFHGRKAREFVLAADRPARVPQIETRARAHRVLLRGGERRQRADVAPVGALLELLHSGNAVLGEVVREDLLGLADARQEVAAEVHLAAAARLFQQAAEHLRLEKIVAHGGIGVARVAGDRRRVFRLFAEFEHAPVRFRLEYAEAACLLGRHRQRRHGDIRAVGGVEVGHLLHVHAIDMVGGEHGDHVGRMRLHQVEILVHGVGGSLKLAA